MLIVVASSLLGNIVVDTIMGLLAEPGLDWRAFLLLLSLALLGAALALYWRFARNPLVAAQPTLRFEVGGLDLFQLLPFNTAQQIWTWLKEKRTEEPTFLARAILDQIDLGLRRGAAFPWGTPESIDKPHEVSLSRAGAPLAARFSVIAQLWDVSRVLNQPLEEWYGQTPKLLVHLRISIKVGATGDEQQMIENPLLVTYRLLVKTPSRPMSTDFVERFGADILPQLGSLTAYAIHQAASTDKEGKNKRPLG